jgi:hypothetical protein
MSDSHEHQIQTLVIILTLIFHGILLYTLFVLTDREYYEPSKITIRPQPLEYFLAQRPPHLTQQTAAHSPQQVIAQPPCPTLIQAKNPQQEPEDADTYTVKNPVSNGTLIQGSIVINQAGSGQEKDSKTDEQNESEEKLDDQKTDIKKIQEPDIKTQEPSESESVSQKKGYAPPSDIFEIADRENDDEGTAYIGEPIRQQKQVHQAVSHNISPSTVHNKTTTKKQLTLADITRGYIRQVKKEQASTGHCSYNSQGLNTMGPNGAYAPPASGIALSEQLYASKLYALLEQSSQAYSRQIYSYKDLEMTTSIEVTIEKSGKILDVTLNPEIPEKDMERALFNIVQRVGLFPPIPKQFKKQRIILSIPIHIKSQQGFASYRLLYGMKTT